MASQAYPQAGPPASTGSWLNSVWDCFKPTDLCCMAYWCPCILFAKTHERLEDPTLSNYSTVNPMCMGHCCLAYVGGLHFILAMMDRDEIRRRHNLPGSGLKDCLLSYCCHCCTLMQHEKEVIARAQPLPQTEPYKTEAPMVYPQGV